MCIKLIVSKLLQYHKITLEQRHVVGYRVTVFNTVMRFKSFKINREDGLGGVVCN